jgi:hypothetical protein
MRGRCSDGGGWVAESVGSPHPTPAAPSPPPTSHAWLPRSANVSCTALHLAATATLCVLQCLTHLNAFAVLVVVGVPACVCHAIPALSHSQFIVVMS